MKTESKNESPKNEPANTAIITRYIADNYTGGSDDLTAADRDCLGRLLAAVEKCNLLYERTRQTAAEIAAGLSMYKKSKTEYDRLMGIGLVAAAADAAADIPKFIASIQAARRQMREMAGEIGRAKADFVKYSGIGDLQEQYHRVSAAFDRLRQKTAFIERTADYCQRQADMVELNCKQAVEEAENHITIPDFDEIAAKVC